MGPIMIAKAACWFVIAAAAIAPMRRQTIVGAFFVSQYHSNMDLSRWNCGYRIRSFSSNDDISDHEFNAQGNEQKDAEFPSLKSDSRPEDEEIDVDLLSLGEEELLAYLETDLDELFSDVAADPQYIDSDDYDFLEPNEEELAALEIALASELVQGSNNDDSVASSGTDAGKIPNPFDLGLERALRAGIVPADATVGSGVLPGDYGFDPLNLASCDLFLPSQRALVDAVNFIWEPLWKKEKSMEVEEKRGEGGEGNSDRSIERPQGLILRDYAEAEIRHGRVAMLAAVIWPLEEILDRFFLDPSVTSSTTILYGGTTLPYLPLLMTFCLLNLGYLDIYSQAVKDMDAGEAFVPGDCFWDPLSILVGAPHDAAFEARKKEVTNGRAAMVAVFAFSLQEGITHIPIVDLPWNTPLFVPAFEIPAVREVLDCAGGGICG